MAVDDPHDLPLAPYRVRHIVSLHLRNFSPQGTASSSSHQLHAISLGIATSQDAEPIYLTDVSAPSVHVNWTVDPRTVASSSQAKGRSRGLIGQGTFAISAWAKETGELAGDDDDEGPWRYCWQKDVDMSSLQPITGGLTSPQLRRLPPNSLILGLQTQTVRSSRHHSGITADTQQVAKDVAAGQANPSTQVRYYLVVQSHASRRRRSTLRSKANSRLNHQASNEAQDDDRGIASEQSGNDTDDSDDVGPEEMTGYDSETAYELSHKNRAGSPTHQDTNRRPTLDRRRSSNRTLKAIKQDRSRRRSASRSQSNADATKSPPQTPSQSHAQWKLQREREKEVLERSKWETRMLASYSRQALHDIVDLQLQASTETDAFGKEKDESNKILRDLQSTFAQARHRSSLQGRLTHLETLKESQDGDLRSLRSKISERKEDLARRRARLDFVRRELTQQQQQLLNSPKPSFSTEELESLHLSIHNRRAHLLETLSFIFPIRLVSASDLLFSIVGQALPNSPDSALLDKNPYDEEVIAAALGFTAQLVLLLSSYLETSLHYDIATAGSRAMIRDGISIMNGPRSFPLYSKGAEMYRFEYAVFLLNKNIEQLMNVHKLPVLDLRHILPNLNSLILTLSAPLSHHQLQAPSTSSKTKKRLSSTNGGATYPIATMNTKSSQFSRKGYKMVGKGEIILPSSKKSQAEEETKNSSVDQASTETAPGVPPAPPSAALSWTASLFGRSSRTVSSNSTVAGGKNGPGSRPHSSENEAQTQTQS